MTATLTAPASAAAHPAAPGWDSEVFVLRSDDRENLRRGIEDLAELAEQSPDLDLTEAAARLAGRIQPNGSRLAIVASSAADLAKKLRRAADRLADPRCTHIRDSAGVYFTERPLLQKGTLALLFPGEGAQYLNMLADLCGVFPEVEATFAWCDQLAAEAGRPESSLRRLLHLPPDATAEARAAAEAELRRLGPSIFGVLVADLAIIRVLWNLQVPVSAVAGHSAGELAALLASGAMQSEAVLGPRLAEIMEMMQRQEDESGGPDVALLAVGAGKAAVVEAANAVGRGEVIVAMDNCPHQCVAVGPTPHVAAVEAKLLERGVICERLPFRRPYHTPLFEPWMGPFRELFADVPFQQAATPAYCCSTGERFPDDADSIRQLTVNHWVRPVEFTRMIERMHGDGVRLFVEAGPRGNLSAFVEDILRGKEFAAIPANLPRKSGPTQINHLVAQLVVHDVPLNLAHLYAGRTAAIPANPEPTRGGDAGGPAAIVNDYLGVMEQFLDVQRSVMEAYLGGGGGGGSLPSLEGMPGDDWLLGDELFEPQQPPPGATPGYCLVGKVEHLEPGREIVFRRVMDEREDRYVDDHTLGGRGVSRADPGQNGLPVLPMTFSLEAMAEAASILAPGKVITAIRDIRLYRWLPFDPEPTTLEVRAKVESVDPKTGAVRVAANVRDLGNSFLPDGAGKASSEAAIILGDRYPDPPPLLPFNLTEEQPCKSTVDDLRRNMFHGPLFQMIRSLGRCGREGIEGTLEVQPRDRWFRSNPDPQVVIDPVLVDAAMHILGAWHLEQPDWSGRILLPIGVKSLEFFGPVPPVGSRFMVRGHNEEETARQARHGVELFSPEGRLWFRMTGAAYWRFYLPFGDVNFFGPKDQYFLSSRWKEAEAASAASPSRCYFLAPPLDLQQPVLRASGVRVTMTPGEIAEFQSLTGPDPERSAWFFTRLLAKDAVRSAWNEVHGGGTFPADMETEAAPDGRLVILPRTGAEGGPYPPVAVATADGKVAAFAAFANYVGIGLVTLRKNATAEVERAARERTACLAVADALRLPAEACTVARLDLATGAASVAIVPSARSRHPGVAERVRAQTARDKDVVIATTLCEADHA